jgi:hypothetical protein
MSSLNSCVSGSTHYSSGDRGSRDDREDEEFQRVSRTEMKGGMGDGHSKGLEDLKKRNYWPYRWKWSRDLPCCKNPRSETLNH